MRSVLNVGDKVEAKIVNIDRKSRSIGLSIKAKDMDDEKKQCSRSKTRTPQLRQAPLAI